ncbi:serine/threonine-protein kinase, partial [Streptomyces sp. NPDC058677]
MAVFEVLEPGDPQQVGRYRIVARLGAGGMGQVYLARSPGGRAVAVKTVRPELAREVDFRRRFAREVTAARRVNGAFTAGVVDADPDGSPAWLATVYVPGVSLGEAVAGHGPWPVRPVLALGAGLAEALEAIHAVGVVHRDLKPSNILLAADGPRVIDFGISVASEASVLTHTGVTIGTPGFMSPEQLTGQEVGSASDVFALGAVLAYTATGVGPFGTGTPHALHYRAVHEPPNLDHLPPELREVVAACLAKDPEQRPIVADLLDQLATTGSADGATAAATLLFTEPGWMPEQIARLVQAHTSTALPCTPPPTPSASPPDMPPSAPTPPTPPVVAPTPDSSTPAPTPSGALPLLSAQPPNTQPALPAAPPSAPEMHQAPTRTGKHLHPVPPQAAPTQFDPAKGTADLAPLPHGDPSRHQRRIPRRRALLGLAGTALTAGAGFAGWKILTSDAPGTGSRPTGKTSPSPTASPTGPPGTQLWKFPTGGAVGSSPA